MKPSTKPELERFVPTKHTRRHRPRPVPRWLKAQASSEEAIAQRRCLLMLSVLSGEKPVTDAIAEAGISRQLYYQLEEKALAAMLKALSPSAPTEATAQAEVEQLKRELDELHQRVRQLETQKRRAERLLLLTRKVVQPGPVKVEGRGRPRRSSTRAGLKPSPTSPASTTASPSSETSTTVPGETTL